MSLAAVLSMIYGLKRIAQDGFDVQAAGAIAAGLVVGMVFAIRQKRLKDPLLDLRLFKEPAFGVSVATNALGGFMAFGTFLFIAQYLQLVLGLSPLQAGLWSLPSSIAIVASSNLAPIITGRFRPAYAASASLTISAIGLLIFTQVEPSSGLLFPVVASTIFGLGLGPVFILTTDLIVGTAPPERAGAASAISETGFEFGGALGIAVLGSIGIAIYRSRLADAVPSGVPEAAADAARDTLGGAIAAAQQLPEAIGQQLVDVAQAAFTLGLQVATGIGSAIAVGIAILVATRLRHIPSHDESEQLTSEVR